MHTTKYASVRTHAVTGRTHTSIRKIRRTKNQNEQLKSSRVCCRSLHTIRFRTAVIISMWTRIWSNWIVCNRWARAVATRACDIVPKRMTVHRRRIQRRPQRTDHHRLPKAWAQTTIIPMVTKIWTALRGTSSASQRCGKFQQGDLIQHWPTSISPKIFSYRALLVWVSTRLCVGRVLMCYTHYVLLDNRTIFEFAFEEIANIYQQRSFC